MTDMRDKIAAVLHDAPTRNYGKQADANVHNRAAVCKALGL